MIENKILLRGEKTKNEFCMIASHGFDGRGCIAKFICDVSSAIPSESGFFHRIYQLIFK